MGYRAPAPRGQPAPVGPLVVMVVYLLLVLTSLGSFWAGRIYESRTQLGYLLAAAPALEELEAATRSADSLSMRFMLQMERLGRKR